MRMRFRLDREPENKIAIKAVSGPGITHENGVWIIV